ncbi:nuclear pore complex protein Nup98-Nup96 [Anopheles stephensi]|uniref:nuclear pore complex protein Nup98-Nup96 n=1 Tax=Anopheles stephensi TaxID=30069 RepID=UPI0016589861|nr:nuclear pore complex protein Nup98-Nup96 [Anopheles stephensi]
MFGAKPGGFGQPTTNTGFGTFGTNTAAASPFGQTTAFSKPATGAFGATPAFGQQPTTSLFGQTQQAGGLFGASTSTAPAFGAATTQPGFGVFGQTQPQTTSLFGTQNNTAANTSLFGNNNNTSFGAAKPAGFGVFGQPATQTTSLFGQSTTNNTATTGFFGQNTQTPGGLFGAAKPAFGAAAVPGVVGGNGTAVAKYQQTHGTDTLVKNGQTTTVNTKQHCITFMKDYENKSVEELRFEDYAANRKGPQAGAPGAGGLFGAGTQSTGLFGGTGATQTTGLFGQNQAQPNAGGLFGTSTNTFGATTTPAFGTTAGSTFGKPFGSNPAATSAPGFGFAQSTTSTLGGGLGANKPAFGATGTTGGLFGQTAAPATSTFGQTSFGGFGTQNTATQPGGLFSGAGAGAAAPGAGAFGTLGAQSTPSSFNFGTNTQTSAAGSTLFGAKPANTFGTLGGTTFGQSATSNAPTFGLGTNTNTAGGNSFFGNTFNKQAAPTFGLGTNTSTGVGIGGTTGGLTFGTGSSSLFGNTAAKPGGLGTGTSLFGNTSTLGGGGTFGTMNMGTSFGAGAGAGGLGMSNLGGLGAMAQGAAGQQAAPIHQQILAMATSPYGDNPIFKGIKPLAGPSEESLKPTNPSAQKAILEGSNYQLKISSRSGNTDRVKVKPLGAAQLKKSIFEGLEEYDSTLEDSFTLKPNAKRLIIKPRPTKSTIIIPDAVGGTREAAYNLSGGSNTSIVGDDMPTPTRASAVAGESFRNQIPTHPTDTGPSGKYQQQQQQQQQQQGSTDGSRRVSWLQSNVLDKVRQQQQSNNQRLSESVLDNTIKEFAVSSSNMRSERASSMSSGAIREESGEADETGLRKGTGKDSTSPVLGNQTVNDSFISNRSFLNETSVGGGIGTDLSTSVAAVLEDAEPHPTGIVLRRVGYYTIPTLDEIAQLMDDEGRCIVPNFTIGRKGYGNVYFNEPIDVAGLNLDEIVHFRHKEVIIYPDDENKPPVGTGLNRKAQITLDQVWPHDKTLHEPIKDPQRLALLDYEGKLRRVCDKHDTRFLEYRPDTGSWVFKVEHFSKYGLSDSDDEDSTPTDPKKVKVMPAAQQRKELLLRSSKTQPPLKQQDKDNENATASPGQEMAANERQQEMDTSADKPAVTTNATLRSAGGFENGDDDDYSRSAYGDENMNFSAQHHRDNPTSPTAAIAMEMGTDPHKIQLMKASFFADDDFDGRSVTSEFGHSEGRDSPDQIVPSAGTRPTGPGTGGLLLQSLYNTNSVPSVIQRKSHVPLAGSLLKMDGSPSVGCFSPGSLMKTSTAKSMHAGGSTLSVSSSKQTATSKQPAGVQQTTLAPIPRPTGPQALPLLLKPKIESLHPINIVIPLSKSVLKRFLNNKSNLAFFHGRKFKVGWTHGTAMVQLNTRDNCTELVRQFESVASTTPGSKMKLIGIDRVKQFLCGRSENDFSPAALQLLRIKSTADRVLIDDESFARSVVGHLRVQLRNGERRHRDTMGNDCPHLVAAGKYQTLEEHLLEARSMVEGTSDEYGEFCAQLWSLLASLWGAREELEEVDEASHLSTMFRRDLFSEWIEHVVTIHSQQTSKRAEKRDYLDQLLELIHTHKVLEACELAFTNNDINLAMLLAQISGGPVVRQLLQHQLSYWQDSEADKFIDPRRLEAFMAIAGVRMMSSSHGPINMLERVDWLGALALHLWYICPPTASITDALMKYEEAYESAESFTHPPLPPYRARYTQRGLNNAPLQDLRFHLLKLYSKRSYPLEALLNPASHTADPTDFRLSWLLLQVLETLGYHHCSEHYRGKIHVEFAAQLESHGLWQWAVYVLLHLNDQARREHAIQQILYRYVQLTPERGGDSEDDGGTEQDREDYLARESFIVDELGIPERWIFWAKAVRASAVFDYRQQAHYLLQAKQWALAHDVILQHLAPEYVMNNKIPQLKAMLDAIEDTKQIANWTTKGQILVDFIELNEKFELLKDVMDEDLMEQRLESLKPKLSELCSVIKMFPCPTPKHTLLQSEIAQRLAFLIRTHYADDPQISGSTLMRGALERLPLPEEHVLEELDHMLRAFLVEELKQK